MKPDVHHTKADTGTFGAALLLPDKKWEHHECPLPDTWIKTCGTSIQRSIIQQRKGMEH